MNEDKSTRYHRLQRRASILAAAALLRLVLILFVASGGSAALRDALGGSRPWVAMVLYVVVLALALELVQLPLAYYQGVTLERRYGLSTQPAAALVARSRSSPRGIGLVLAARGHGALLGADPLESRSLVDGGGGRGVRCCSPAWLWRRRWCCCRSSTTSRRSSAPRWWRGSRRWPRVPARRSSASSSGGWSDGTRKANAALAGIGRHAAHPGLGHPAGGPLRRRDRGHPGARARRITSTATSGRRWRWRAC